MRTSALFLRPKGNSIGPGDRALDEAALDPPISVIVVGVDSGDRASTAAARSDPPLMMLSSPAGSASKSRLPKLILKPGAKVVMDGKAIKLAGGLAGPPSWRANCR